LAQPAAQGDSIPSVVTNHHSIENEEQLVALGIATRLL